MLKFMKNTQKITPERLQKQKELFDFNKACYHGFPAKPSALAWDPQLRLLALATKTAEIRIYGIPGVEVYGRHDNSEAPVTHLTFLSGQCRLVSLCEDNSLHLWQLTPQESSGMQLLQTNSTSLEGKLKKISVVVADSSGEHLMVGTEGGNIYLLNLSTFAMSDNIIYQDVVMQNVPEDYKVNPGPVEAIAEHPTEPDKVLIGYQRGLIVLWDKKNLCADQTYVCSQQLESVCWHADGSQFTTSHNDGSYMVWSSTESANPSDGPHTVYGPFPCKPITKILRPCSKSGDLIVFCGGMPRASYGDRNTVTVICGEYHVTFNITSKIIDYTVVADDEAGHASCLVVLAEEEIVFIDLDSEEWPAFSSPYLSCLHSSAVTCSFLASSVSTDIYDKIKEAGEKQQGGLSKRPWPINGGKLKNTDVPNQRDILLTGHEDGTVQFWDASGVSLTLLYKLVTAQLFVSEDLGGDGAAAEDDDWPPFRKTGLFDPYSDDPRLGVKKMEMCPYTGMLVVAGTAGQILILNLEMEEKEIVPECVNVNVVAETDNFVWKSHNKLDMQTEAVKFGAGMQPTVVVQFYPPASCTSLTLHSEWGLVACGTAHGFALFDIIQKKNILSKSTLSPLDLANAADEGPMSRRKSLKKSLRESFRRLRRGRSQRKTGKTIATSPTSPDEDESEEGEEEEFDMSDEGEGEEEEEAGKDDNGEKEYSVVVQALEEVPLEQSADPPPLGTVEAPPGVEVLPAVEAAPVVEADIQVADEKPQVEEDNIEIEEEHLDGEHVLNNPGHGIKKEESTVEKTGVTEQVPFFYYVTPKIFRETTKQAPERERKESKGKLKKEVESVEDSKGKSKFSLNRVFTRKEKIGSVDEQTEDEHDNECKLKKEATESVEDGKGKTKFRLTQVFSRKEKIGSVDEQTEDEYDNECKLKKEEETESVEDGKGKSKFRLAQVFSRKEKIGSVDEQTEDEHDNESKLKKEEETESVEDCKGKSKFRLTQVFSRKEKIGSGSIDEQTEDEHNNECKLKKEEETESVEDGKGKSKFRLTQVFSRKEKRGSIDEQTEDEHDNECKLKKEEETESVEDGKGKSKFRLTQVFSRKEKIGSVDEQTEDEHHNEYMEPQQKNPSLFQKIFSHQVTEQEGVMDVDERPASAVSTPKGVHRLKDWLQKREEEDEMAKVEGVEQTESREGSLRRLFRRSRPPTLDSPLEEEVQKSSGRKSPMEPSLSKHQRLKFAFKQRSQSEEALPPSETGQIYTIKEAQVKSRSLTRPSKLWLTSHSQRERRPSPITSETSPVVTDAPDPSVTSALGKGEHEPKKRTFFTLPLKGLKSRQESESELLKRIPSDIYNVDDKDVIHRTPSYERAISYDIIKSKISEEKSSDPEGGTGKFKQLFKQRSEVILRPFNRRNKNPENRKSAPIPVVSQTEENVEVPDIEARHPSISTYIDDTPTSATSAVLPEIPPGIPSPKPSHPSQPQQVREALSPEQFLTPDSEADSVVLDLRSLQSTPDIVRKVPDSRGSTLERTFSRRLTFSLPFGSAGGGGAMSAEEEGVKPVERSIEARSQTSDYIGSMVRCLHLTKCFIANTQVMSATLWAGTNSGAIFVFTIAIPPSEKRGDITLTVQLGKEIHLKHGAPVISVRILDGASRPFPEPMAVKKDAAPAHNSNQPHRVLICSEEQFKVFTLPQLKPYCKFKLTAHEGSRVRKIGYSKFVSSADSAYTEAGFTVITNLGDFNVFSVPDCRRQIQETYIKKEDISGINSVVFSSRGEALYMMSPCELERVSLSARHVTRASGTVPVLIKPKPTAEEVKEELPKIKPNDEPTQDEDRDAPTSPDTAAEAPAVPPTVEREAENESNKDKEEKEEKDEKDTTEAVGGNIKKLEDVKENGDSSVLSGDITIDSIRDHMDDLKVCEKSDKTELMMDGGNNGRTVLTSSTSTMKQESSSSVTVVKSTTITSVSSSSQESSSVQVVETASTEVNHSTLNGTE